jgi:titin
MLDSRKTHHIMRAGIGAAILAVAVLAGSIGGLTPPDPAQAAPPNDAFPGTAVGAVPYSDTQDTTTATPEAGEPFLCGANTMSVWYSFTIPVGGTYAFDTFGSDFATTVNLFTGATIPTLGSVGCVGISHNTYQSLAVFGGAPGTVVRVQVTGFTPAGCCYRTSGNMRLHITKYDGFRTVNSADDVDDTVCDGTHCSLREAINSANASADTSLIAFGIASGPQTITPGSALPVVSTKTFIDASTQPGATTAPIIEIDATSTGGNGLNLTAGNSLVTGLVVNRAPGYGIALSGSGGNVVSGNYIGTNAAGTAASANVTGGVNIDGVADNVIGAGQDRQVISGNGSSAGVRVAGAGATGNRVQGNYIGTNATAAGAVGNTYDGVLIQDGAASNLVGGTHTLERNVISGNGSNGVLIHFGGTDNSVVGNYIGTDSTATAAIGNATNGVRVHSTADSTVGGTTAAERNIISGNGFTFAGSGVAIAAGSSGNVVRGNWIGLKSDGLSALGNAEAGVIIDAAPSNFIGDAANAAANLCEGGCNLIQYNDRGVEITGPSSTGNVVRHNAAFYNVDAGLRIQDFASSNTIGVGGAGLGNGNTWSGSGRGVDLKDGANNNTFKANAIGVDRFATSAIPNSIGVYIHDGADDNIIGGTVIFTESNLISGNTFAGVVIYQADGNTIRNSGIGVDISVTTDLANGTGVIIDESNDTVIGGTPGNVISGNTGNGISIVTLSNAATGTLILGNVIGLDLSSNPIPNGGNGIEITAGFPPVSGTYIGGSNAAARNIISANGDNGVLITGPSGTSNFVQGNYIGTDIAGTSDRGNGSHGVVIDGMDGNTVGGNPGQTNLISGNDADGVHIIGADNTLIQGNLIGTDVAGTGSLPNTGNGVTVIGGTGNTITGGRIDANSLLGIDLGDDGVTANDAGDADAGANGLQNYPAITSAKSGGSGSMISGSLDSTASRQFTLEFFSSPSCDGSGFGEGRTAAGTMSVTTSGAGTVSFTHLTNIAIPVGHVVTATATDTVTFDTSEFSQCATVTACTGDTDCDGLLDASDNCPSNQNPGQENTDRNFIDQTGPSTQDDRTVANSDAAGDACDTDDDNDGLTDADEESAGACDTFTNPLLADTDGDRYLDGAECDLGADPTSSASKPTLASCAAAGDADGDKIQSRVEVCHYNTDPNDTDTDGDLDGFPTTGLTKDGCEIASLNNDRVVNAADQLLMATAISTPFYLLSFDLNKDGGVNAGDQLIMATLITPPGQCP